MFQLSWKNALQACVCVDVCVCVCAAVKKLSFVKRTVNQKKKTMRACQNAVNVDWMRRKPPRNSFQNMFKGFRK